MIREKGVPEDGCEDVPKDSRGGWWAQKRRGSESSRRWENAEAKEKCDRGEVGR